MGTPTKITGAGIFDTQHKSTKAAGTFTHKATNGTVLETGVWITSDLISFTSYGIAPAALQNGPAFGSPQIGPKRAPIRPGPLPTGGLGLFRVILMPLSGGAKTAVLQVNCVLGDVPRERSVEGIRLLFNGGTEFAEEAGGCVIFLPIRAKISAAAETTKQVPAPESAAKPPN